MTRTILVIETECEHGKARPHRPTGAARMCVAATRHVLKPEQTMTMHNGFVFTVAEVLEALNQLEFDRNGLVV